MNILHIEEMIEAEKGLLLEHPQEKYRLNLPDGEEVTRLHSYCPKFLTATSPAAQQEVDKMLTHTKNLISMRQGDANSTLRMFACAVLAVIYPPATAYKPSATNNLLLQTLKCTLYSNDVKLSLVENSGVYVDDLQAKAMIARFFDVLSIQKDAIGCFSKYIELFFDKNPLLLDLFTIFYRLVLHNLGIERAINYQSQINFQETLVNLVEYFDVSYRNRSQLFLFFEQNIFIAVVGDEVVLGEYLDNQIDPKEISFKDSRGFNLIQSFLLRSSQKECKLRLQRQPKTFNFSFQSGDFRNLKCEQEKSIDLDTPHFNESTEFVFGRRKKEQEGLAKDEQLRKQISKNNLNASIDSFKDFNFNQYMGILKSIEERQNVLGRQSQNVESKDLPRQQIKNKQFFNMPIKELDQKLQQSKISVDRSRNIVNVKDKTTTLLTPQVNSNNNHCFGSIDNDAIFLKQSNGNGQFSSSENIDDQHSELHHLSECKCRVYRLARNSLASTVVSFAYIPVQKRKMVLKPPSFITSLTYSQRLVNCESSRVHSPKVKRLMTLEQKPIQEAKESRKPAFLKFLKKNKEIGQKESQSSHYQSKKSKVSNPNSPIAKDNIIFDQSLRKQEFKVDDKFKRFSGFHQKAHNENRIKDLQFRQTLRRNDYNSNNSKKKTVQHNTVLKKFDINNMLYRPSLGIHWQSASSFQQPSQVTPRRYTKEHINYTHENVEKVTKVYAPIVHINAPTVYLHANTQPNSRTSFNVNVDSPPQTREKTQLKESQRVLRSESSIHLKKEGK